MDDDDRVGTIELLRPIMDSQNICFCNPDLLPSKAVRNQRP